MRIRGLAIVLVAVVVAIVALIAFNGPLRPPSLDPEVGVPRETTPPSLAPEVVSPPPVGLHLDGLATVTAPGGLRLREEPAGRKVKGASATIANGTVVFLDSQRVAGEGVTWWAVYPSSGFLDYGWVPGEGTSGQPTLEPIEPACIPKDSLDAAALARLGWLPALVCYGDDDLHLRGEVTCEGATVDAAIAGASWLPLYAVCNLDDALNLDGHFETTLLAGQPSPPNAISGQYEVVGHFDDLESRLCFSIGFGGTVSGPVNAPDPAAVLGCRQQFVVTSLTPVP